MKFWDERECGECEGQCGCSAEVRGTIQCCPDVKFVSVGAHMDKRKRNGVCSGHCTVAFTYVA